LRGDQLIRRATLERMLAPTRLNDGSLYPYGFGWGTAEYRGHPIFHHTGGISGFASQMLHFQGEALTTIVLSNLYMFPFDQVTRGLVKSVKGWREGPETPTAITAAGIAPYAGRYENEDGPIVVGANPEQWSALSGDRLCSPSDPEVEFRFSEPDGGRFLRLDYASPLWPISTFRRTG
jgi:hypothetical protein